VFILSCSGGGRASGVSSGDVMPDSWRGRASCLGVDPDLFFPDGEASRVVRAQVARARAVCAACPVLAECREFELTPPSSGGLRNDFGVFAGMTADERRTELGARRAAAAGRGVAA
jgi:WhiB family redox-sensing transcriptional regulator